MDATESVSAYIKGMGITVAKMSKATGIQSSVLYDCFDKKKTRKLNADEFLKVCLFLHKDPVEFSDTSKSA